MLKSVKIYTVCLLAGFVLWPMPVLCAGSFPESRDLLETHAFQRRDLSMPDSRIVINFYDFNGKQTAAEYSNRPTLPLNAAYLSTHKNEVGKSTRTRFSRAVTDLLIIRKSDRPFEEMIHNQHIGNAGEYSTQWMPHCLGFQGSYPDHASLYGTDFLYDEKTIVRKIKFTGNAEGYCISGNYNGNISREKDILMIGNNHLRYAIAFSVPVACYKTDGQKWHIQFEASSLEGKKELIITVAFADEDETTSTLLKRAGHPVFKNDTDAKLREREAYWDGFLAKVPRPSNFDLSHVNTYGVTAAQLKSAYYKAWVFTAQNILPSDKQVFPYPQFCTGKPSLWDEGEVRAPLSAAWESFIGMQLYAFIDPVVSWQAFKGLMTLVDKDGMLGGESLPSRKAQTALILYRYTNDKKSLQEVYPALKRYLVWRMNITHWVYQDIKQSVYSKDAEFAFSALVDMEHMVEIARILGLTEDQKEWNNKHKILCENSLQWFWETPVSLPVQYYDTRSQHRNRGNSIWVTTGLYVDNLLKDSYLQSMMNCFYQDFDPDKPFAGFSIPKYPDVSYTVYGLLKQGYKDEAVSLMEANLRDIVRANSSFAEQYIGENFEPDGVRPSLFGSSTLIDFVLLLNGYKYDRGNPSANHTVVNFN